MLLNPLITIYNHELKLTQAHTWKDDLEVNYVRVNIPFHRILNVRDCAKLRLKTALLKVILCNN